MTEIYTKTALFGDSIAAFRNSDDEPWIRYQTPRHGAVLSFAPDKSGYMPLPEWTRIDG